MGPTTGSAKGTKQAHNLRWYRLVLLGVRHGAE